jgi:hypothetical protein
MTTTTPFDASVLPVVKRRGSAVLAASAADAKPPKREIKFDPKVRQKQMVMILELNFIIAMKKELASADTALSLGHGGFSILNSSSGGDAPRAKEARTARGGFRKGSVRFAEKPNFMNMAKI